MTDVVVLGVVFGVGAALSVGPIFLTIVYDSVTHGFAAGARVILGSAAGDILLLIPALGASWLFAQVDSASAVLALAGAAYFIVLGVMAARRGHRLWNASGATVLGPPDAWSFARGLLGNVLNPLSWAFWLATGTPTMLHAYRVAAWGGLMTFTLVWFSVAMAVECAIALGIAQTRKLLTSRALALLQSAAAVTFLMTAALLLLRR